MEKTANLNLSQWDQTDRILMEDFNADNAKIEEAILNRLGQMQLIKTVTPTEGSTLTLDLSDISWEDWAFLIVIQPGKGTSASNAQRYVNILTRGGATISSYNSVNDGHFADHNNGPAALIFLPRHSGENPIWAISLSNTGGFCTAEGTFSELGGLKIYDNYGHSPDRPFHIFGMA